VPSERALAYLSAGGREGAGLRRRPMCRRVLVAVGLPAAALFLTLSPNAWSQTPAGETPATAPSAESPASSAPAEKASTPSATEASTGAAPAGAAPAGADAPAAQELAPKQPWRFTGTLGVISLPRVLALELLARYRRKDDPRWDSFAFGAAIDYLPPGLADFGSTKLSWLATGAEGKWFPWRFVFIGARLGWQFARADSEKFGSSLDYRTSSLLFAPKVGVLYTLPSRLTLGGDLGATIPIAATTALDSDSTEDSNARKVAKTFGMFVMPFLSLRIGYTL